MLRYLLLLIAVSGCSSTPEVYAPVEDAVVTVVQPPIEETANELTVLADKYFPVTAAAVPMSKGVTLAATDSYKHVVPVMKSVKIIKKTVKETLDANGKVTTRETTEETIETTPDPDPSLPVDDETAPFVDRMRNRLEALHLDAWKSIVNSIAGILGGIVAVYLGFGKIRTLFTKQSPPLAEVS